MKLPFPLRQIIFATLVTSALCAVCPFAAARGESTLNTERMKSPADVGSTLELLQSKFTAVKAQSSPSFEMQKMIVLKSGDCITRLVDLSQKADLSQGAQQEEFRKLFLKNAELLREIIAYNRTRIDDVLEDKLAGTADKSAFYSSSEWQQSQYLLSLASYWQGWNGYYGGILYTGNASARAELLEEAAAGFTFVVLNIQEQSFVIRSILGRGLCFKELKRYDKAQQDLQSVMSRVSHEDPVYAQAGYERALLSYQSGNKARALEQIKQLEETLQPKALTPQLKEKLHSLQVNIALGAAENKSASQPDSSRESPQETVRSVKRIAYADESQADILYQYVLEHAAALADLPDSELGSMGTMAIADWYFDRKQYDQAIVRYQRIYNTPDALIKRHMDTVCFRLAYALAQREKWQNALSCLETLFTKYPKSSFDGKAACLYYVSAVHVYKANPNEETFNHYIKAAQCYVKNCSDAQDKSEAHYQIGLYYQRQGKIQEALQEFALVKSDSAHYAEAQQAGILSAIDKLQTPVDRIETLVRQGQGNADETLQLFHDTLQQAENCYKIAAKKSVSPAAREPEAYLTVLLARLYMHGPEPSPHKALPLLQDFETSYPVTRQHARMYNAVKMLRLECYLHLNRLPDAEHEMNRITEQIPVTKETIAFLNYCADRYYRSFKNSKTNGNADQTAGNAQAALLIYKKLADIIPDNTDVQTRLAELYVVNNHADQAEALYRAKLTKDPASADALYQLGLLYEKQSHWQDACAVWQKLARGLKQGTPPWFEVRYRVACSLDKLGKKTDACEVIAATKVRFHDFGNGEYSQKFIQLNKELCGNQ